MNVSYLWVLPQAVDTNAHSMRKRLAGGILLWRSADALGRIAAGTRVAHF